LSLIPLEFPAGANLTNILRSLYSIFMALVIQCIEVGGGEKVMVLLAMVNMILLLVGFLTGLRKKQEATISSQSENNLALDQFTQSQKG